MNQLTSILNTISDAHKDRRWINIRSQAFEDVVDIIANTIERAKIVDHRAVSWMRCCLMFWIGPQPEPSAHVIDDSFNKEFDKRTMLTHSLNQNTLVYGTRQLTVQEKTKLRFEEEERHAYYDSSVEFNPCLDDIYIAYEPYLTYIL